MLFDLNTHQPEGVRDGYDTCIAGGGVAGISLALQLSARGRRVLLLEAGGLEYTNESQDSYRGENTGRAYHDLDIARLRFLGGTSNHWAGRCRTLDAFDFGRDEIAVLCDVPRTATIKAAGELVTLKVTKELFFRMVTDFPEMGVEIMRVLAHRLENTTAQLSAMRAGQGA